MVAGGAEHSQSLTWRAAGGRSVPGGGRLLEKSERAGQGGGGVRSSNRKSDPITGNKKSQQRTGGTALRTDVKALLMCPGCFSKHQGRPLLS